MRMSFIVTTYNLAAYVERCLDSLMPCLRPGDEVILVDDGSTDQTDLMVEKRFTAGFGPDVGSRLVLLGTNTMGGVGIPANVGISFADRDAVFFVDGDDWMEPQGFMACRAAFEEIRPDILIGNYLEHDDAQGRTSPPSDLNRWADLRLGGQDLEARRKIALSMIAVPWRKFYRRDFLGTSLRFPEGDFFFEDNPFHWQVCRAAGSIEFHDRVLCHHRTNRPGQTMASTGTEFLAFFDHYDTICATFDPADTAQQAAALEWLVNNMSWHITRMGHGVYWAYAARAVQALDGRAPLWALIRKQYTGSAIGGMVEGLVRGQIAGTVAAWMADRTQQSVVRMEGRLRTALTDGAMMLKPGQGEEASHLSGKIAEQIQALALIEEFRALLALSEIALPPGKG